MVNEFKQLGADVRRLGGWWTLQEEADKRDEDQAGEPDVSAFCLFLAHSPCFNPALNTALQQASFDLPYTILTSDLSPPPFPANQRSFSRLNVRFQFLSGSGCSVGK